MSVIAADARLSPRATTRAHAVVRRRRYLSFVGTVVLSFVLVVWTLLPIYNMILISLEPEGGSRTGTPTGPMLYSGRLIQVTPIGFRDQTP